MKSRVALLLLPLSLFALSGCGTLSSALDFSSDAPGGPQERDLYLDLITGLQSRDLHRASLAHLDEYDQRFSATPRATRLRAEAYTALGESAPARASWQKLIGTPDEAAAHNGLGRLHARAGEWGEAAAAFSAAVSKAPTTARYINNLGYALLRAGDREGAQFRLLQAEELDHDSAEIRSNVILALMANGRAQEAEARLARVPDSATRASLRREASRAVASLPAARQVLASIPVAENRR